MRLRAFLTQFLKEADCKPLFPQELIRSTLWSESVTSNGPITLWAKQYGNAPCDSSLVDCKLPVLITACNSYDVCSTARALLLMLS